ncbi:MAG: extracellular solute-binding protein [Deltaproteobacteria bacterium]|nr:extracellular solute-binding protein [Deltaproteobacteria bacterium]
MNTNASYIAAAFLLIVCLDLASVHQCTAQGESWDGVIQAAKKESKVVIYATAGWERGFEKGIEIFAKKYGIKVEPLYLRAREAYTRVNTERRAGRQAADVIAVGDTTIASLWQGGGLEHWLPPSIKQIRSEVAELADLPRLPITPAQMNLYGIFINTRLSPAGREPKCWRDLLDPSWRGKITMDDPRAPGAGYTWFISTLGHPELGDAFHHKLAQNKPFIVTGGGSNELQMAVVNGQFAIGIPVNTEAIPTSKGVPAKWIAACEGLYYSLNSAGLIKGAPHPNAAKLWLDLLLSEDVQRIVGEMRTPVRKGIPTARPEWSLDNAKLLRRPLVETPEQRDKIYRLADKIYGAR